ncbi:MAG: ParB N-terminal domain-containing protein, partial [Calditrichaceae bacterium]
MKYKIEYIKLNNISIEQKFNLNTNFGFNSLEESINSVGIIYPLLGWNCDNSIILVDGFKRFRIAKNLRKTELPFILLPSKLELDEIVKIRYHNLKQENVELNAHQKLSIYSMLKEAGIAFQSLESWQRILNLPQYDKYHTILNWPQAARDYIYNYNVSIKQLQYLIKQNNRVIDEIFSIATSLSIRIVELNNIAEMIS